MMTGLTERYREQRKTLANTMRQARISTYQVCSDMGLRIDARAVARKMMRAEKKRWIRVNGPVPPRRATAQQCVELARDFNRRAIETRAIVRYGNLPCGTDDMYLEDALLMLAHRDACIAEARLSQ